MERGFFEETTAIEGGMDLPAPRSTPARALGEVWLELGASCACPPDLAGLALFPATSGGAGRAKLDHAAKLPAKLVVQVHNHVTRVPSEPGCFKWRMSVCTPHDCIDACVFFCPMPDAPPPELRVANVNSAVGIEHHFREAPADEEEEEDDDDEEEKEKGEEEKGDVPTHHYPSKIQEVRQIIILSIAEMYFVVLSNDLVVNRVSHATNTHDFFFNDGAIVGMPTQAQLEKEMMYAVSSSSSESSESSDSGSELDSDSDDGNNGKVGGEGGEQEAYAEVEGKHDEDDREEQEQEQEEQEEEEEEEATTDLGKALTLPGQHEEHELPVNSPPSPPLVSGSIVYSTSMAATPGGSGGRRRRRNGRRKSSIRRKSIKVRSSIRDRMKRKRRSIHTFSLAEQMQARIRKHKRMERLKNQFHPDQQSGGDATVAAFLVNLGKAKRPRIVLLSTGDADENDVAADRAHNQQHSRRSFERELRWGPSGSLDPLIQKLKDSGRTLDSLTSRILEARVTRFEQVMQAQQFKRLTCSIVEARKLAKAQQGRFVKKLTLDGHWSSKSASGLNMSLQERGMDLLVKFLGFEGCLIEHLSLSGNDFKPRIFSKLLFQGLAANTSIEFLNMRRCALGRKSSDGAILIRPLSLLAELLTDPENHCPATLILAGNKINVKCMESLRKIMEPLDEQPCSITSLDLSFNKLGEEGGFDLCRMILALPPQSLHQLQALRVDHNGLESASASIKNAFKSKKTKLKELRTATVVKPMTYRARAQSTPLGQHHDHQRQQPQQQQQQQQALTQRKLYYATGNARLFHTQRKQFQMSRVSSKLHLVTEAEKIPVSSVTYCMSGMNCKSLSRSPRKSATTAAQHDRTGGVAFGIRYRRHACDFCGDVFCFRCAPQVVRRRACLSCSAKLQDNGQRADPAKTGAPRRVSDLASIATTKTLARRLSSRVKSRRTLHAFDETGMAGEDSAAGAGVNIRTTFDEQSEESSDDDGAGVVMTQTHSFTATAPNELAGDTAESLFGVDVDHKQPVQTVFDVVILGLIMCFVYADLGLDVASIIEYSAISSEGVVVLGGIMLLSQSAALYVQYKSDDDTRGDTCCMYRRSTTRSSSDARLPGVKNVVVGETPRSTASTLTLTADRSTASTSKSINARGFSRSPSRTQGSLYDPSDDAGCCCARSKKMPSCSLGQCCAFLFRPGAVAGKAEFTNDKRCWPFIACLIPLQLGLALFAAPLVHVVSSIQRGQETIAFTSLLTSEALLESGPQSFFQLYMFFSQWHCLFAFDATARSGGGGRNISATMTNWTNGSTTPSSSSFPSTPAQISAQSDRFCNCNPNVVIEPSTRVILVLSVCSGILSIAWAYTTAFFTPTINRVAGFTDLKSRAKATCGQLVSYFGMKMALVAYNVVAVTHRYLSIIILLLLLRTLFIDPTTGHINNPLGLVGAYAAIFVAMVAVRLCIRRCFLGGCSECSCCAESRCKGAPPGLRRKKDADKDEGGKPDIYITGLNRDSLEFENDVKLLKSQVHWRAAALGVTTDNVWHHVDMSIPFSVWRYRVAVLWTVAIEGGYPVILVLDAPGGWIDALHACELTQSLPIEAFAHFCTVLGIVQIVLHFFIVESILNARQRVQRKDRQSQLRALQEEHASSFDRARRRASEVVRERYSLTSVTIGDAWDGLDLGLRDDDEEKEKEEEEEKEKEKEEEEEQQQQERKAKPSWV